MSNTCGVKLKYRYTEESLHEPVENTLPSTNISVESVVRC